MASPYSEPSLFNKQNRVLSHEEVATLLNRYGIAAPPRNIDLYRRAFVHRSYILRKNDSSRDGNSACPVGCMPLQEDSYERLEFLGDAVLNIAVTDYLYRRYFYEGEGFLTRMRTKFINGIFLGNLARSIGLSDHVVISASNESSGGREQTKTLEDVFEAFLGAIFEDFNTAQCGYETARAWLTSVLETHVDFADMVLQNQNHKERLTRHMHTHMGAAPRFEERKRAGGGIITGVTIAVIEPGGETIGLGTGDTRRAAEQEACMRALTYFGVQA